MSIWTDIGIVNGRMDGVIPCEFLNTAYDFFYELRMRIWPDTPGIQLPDFDYSLIRKDTMPTANVMTFPNWADDIGETRLERPIPESYWNSTPRWGEILEYTEETLLDEEIVEYRERPIMDPAWPTQRYKIIQNMRYLTIPLYIRMKYNTTEWRETGDRRIDADYQYYGSKSFQIDAKVEEYWTKGNAVCKIGYEGGWTAPDIQHSDPPINGCAWVNGNQYTSTEYKGESGEFYVHMYGAVDLATHPDFKQYFDINEEEEQ